jgi:hypothetical protein
MTKKEWTTPQLRTLEASEAAECTSGTTDAGECSGGSAALTACGNGTLGADA